MMKNLNIVVDRENSLVYPDRKVVGINYENLQGYINFSFKNGFVDGTAWLEVQMPDGTKGYLGMTKENEIYSLPIKSSLLKQAGRIYMNLRITQGTDPEEIPVFKSKTFYQEVLESINATEEIPDGYESWIDIANEKINEINKAIQEVDNIDIDVEKVDKTTTVTVTKKDGTTKEVEIKDYELTEEDKQEIVNTTIDEIQPQFDNIQEELSQLDKDIVNVDNRVTGLQKDLQEQEENINHLADTKADKTEIPDVSEFIKKTVDNLVNYYKKTETYTQAEVNQLIGAIKTAHFEVVEVLPQIGESNIIYLVPKTTTKTDDIYDEYIYINGAYEFIGSTAVDLSNYYNKEEIHQLLFDYITSNDLEETLKDYVTIAMKYDFVKDGLVNNTNQLTDEEKLKIETWLGLSENYLTYYNEMPYNVDKNYVPAHKKYVDENIKVLDDKVKELELFKFPNMTIVGTPTIQNGQVSGFTMNDYLEFPFLVDFRNRPFEINFAFTTGNNVTTQQNILDSVFGLALAIKNGKTLMAISYDGATWANQYTGTLNIEPNTTYVYRITWNGMLYRVQYYNGSQYVDDFYFASNLQPYPKQMFIGVSKLSDNYFEGSINLNYANLKIDGNVVWSGMDDAGLATRMAVDMSNIDEAGIKKLNELVKDAGYVKNTDYATSSKGGVVKTGANFGIDGNGNPFCNDDTYEQYQSRTRRYFISKGTLENVITGKELVDKTYVNEIVGNIDTILTRLTVGEGVE